MNRFRYRFKIKSLTVVRDNYVQAAIVDLTVSKGVRTPADFQRIGVLLLFKGLDQVFGFGF